MLDKAIKNVRVVRPNHEVVALLDLGIRDGKFVRIVPEIDPKEAREVFDGQHLLGFPGVVDCHTHIGIYRPLAEDAITESQAAAAGGVTTVLTYIRTGQYYLNRSGTLGDFFPELLALSEGNYYVDYGYHLAPISSRHIEEMDSAITEFGVPSFKIFMFYGGYGLHGRSAQQNSFLMLSDDERYDLAHFEFIMRRARSLMDMHPELADYVGVSLHCETAEILDAYSRMCEANGRTTGLYAYDTARPPHSEALAICIASYLAHETGCRNINLLHLSSRKAVDAALKMQQIFPHLSLACEAAAAHLLLDVDAPAGNLAKVNPPIRRRQDVEYLWQAVLDKRIDWIVTDHACCPLDQKLNSKDPDDMWLTKAGFGGVDHLLPAVFSEGGRRGMSYSHMAELLCWNPAQRFGLLDKGDIAVGYDADLVLLDPNETFRVRAVESPSAQGYTPFEGMEFTGRVKRTFLRGDLVYGRGRIIGLPKGRYLKRPCGMSKK